MYDRAFVDEEPNWKVQLLVKLKFKKISTGFYLYFLSMLLLYIDQGCSLVFCSK